MSAQRLASRELSPALTAVVAVGLAVRLVAALVLIAGPWTDQPGDLEGWDVERFQAIAERDGGAWVDEPVEYPPGSVVVFDRLAADDPVGTHRRLVVVSLLCDLAAAGLLWSMSGKRVAAGYLALGTPLVPMGLLRLDIMVTMVAVASVAALVSAPNRSEPRRQAIGRPANTAAAVLVAIGTMIKLWPALVALAAWAIGRRAMAVAMGAVTAMAAAVWLVVVGDGLEPARQVLTLRGATGWHVESVPGALVALFGGDEARLEFNAYRIGTLRPTLVTIGRGLALVMMAALALTANRTGTPQRAGHDRPSTVGLVMLGATAALIATAPLLSPQFLIWLTPWGALALAPTSATDAGHGDPRRLPLALLAIAVVLTGFTLTVFGPPNLDQAVPALLLTARNLALLAIPVACLRALRSGVAER